MKMKDHKSQSEHWKGRSPKWSHKVLNKTGNVCVM